MLMLPSSSEHCSSQTLVGQKKFDEFSQKLKVVIFYLPFIWLLAKNNNKNSKKQPTKQTLACFFFLRERLATFDIC